MCVKFSSSSKTSKWHPQTMCIYFNIIAERTMFSAIVREDDVFKKQKNQSIGSLHKRYRCRICKEALSFTELRIPLCTISSCECGTSVFMLHDGVVPRLCQNELWCGNLGLWIFRRVVIKLKWQDIVFVYNAYYMKSSIFNAKCAIFFNLYSFNVCKRF